MGDGNPKDYSSMYREDKPPIPSTRIRPSPHYKTLDGSYVPPKHNEAKQLELMQVAAKLQNLPKEYHSAFAMDTLNKHYSDVFVNRRSSFKAYIKYFDEKDTYVVRVDSNTLKAVIDKLPKKGAYRYFFKGPENTCEEVENDGSTVPYHEKDGKTKHIYCQLFPMYS